MPRYLYLILLLALAGCLQGQPSGPGRPANDELMLATTTSVYDSGLLQVLIPPFEKKCGCRIKVSAQGSGAALSRAKLGGADAVIVHDPEAEEKFMAEGFGVNRRGIMHNDFVIIGPKDDPAGIKGETDAARAMKKIYDAKAFFYSRGDESGTHTREKVLWKKSGLEPQGTWYKRTGSGMGSTIMVADQEGGYTLADRSTFLSMKGVSLVILSEGDPLLLNRYSVIAVNPAKHPQVNYQLAMYFIGYLTSQEGQRMIRDFGKAEHGAPLFHPDALTEDVLG